jgi:hypothetical protein
MLMFRFKFMLRFDMKILFTTFLYEGSSGSIDSLVPSILLGWMLIFEEPANGLELFFLIDSAKLIWWLLDIRLCCLFALWVSIEPTFLPEFKVGISCSDCGT